ncbi:insulinase family protein [Clostridium grantii]|uniref:Peptidase M16C associated domain-containing protein n=1 Tax=Clostridium grantii DSM 8605 TaxID=1121316 RepID=A0A1M5UL86_9CLOT|nr:insulinase family protein [Clostridium grantii]SHH63443.1 hypothetical protein SAMN02745207_01785 [Clostridium grantii DSM 8605]
MNFQLGNIYHGFKLIEMKEVNEINSLYRLFQHEKSGARLMNLQNDDHNKVFAIGFRTPPNDDTGVAHIMEHSVLCGSRKFPIKDPFVELAKGSLNTFLNAMTYPDKTVYPVASMNEQDFFNLMDVYLDAVFYPNIYKYPEILMQEGWHYELNQKEEDVTYKGVVYNEMKGAFSSPEDVLYRNIEKTLFPDTCYGYESGGDPVSIPNLTYNEFLDFHKKYYHPSNSYIYLYGNGDLDSQLQFIDEGYLDNFNKIEIDSSIELQKGFEEPKEIESEYAISDKDDCVDKTYLNLNFVVGENTDKENYLAFNILEYLLLETSAAPLKKALIDANLGKDVFGFYDSSIRQPIFSIVVKNSNVEEKERFKEVVVDTLTDLVKNGIDKKLIEGGLNAKEFALREADTRSYPKGLVHFSKAMSSWLYDEQPLIHIEYEETLKIVKKALNTNYFEELIEKHLLNNNHSSLIVLKPKKGLAEEKIQSIKDKLKKYKESLSEEQMEKLISDTKALIERQQSGETEEDLRKVPLLSLEDIDPNIEEIFVDEQEEQGVKIISREDFTNKIVYSRMLFNSTGVDFNDLPYVGLLSNVLGGVDTEKHNYMDLANEINIATGGIGFSAVTYMKNGDADTFYPRFNIRSKVLSSKIEILNELIIEIINTSKFDDKKRLKEIIQEMKSRLEMAIYDSGHLVAANRNFVYFSKGSHYDDIISGLEFYKFIVDIDKNFDSKWQQVAEKLNQVSKKIFNKNNLTLALTCDKEDFIKVKNHLPHFINNLNDDKIEYNSYNIVLSQKNEALLTQSDVQYVTKGFNFIKLGYKYSGSLLVLKTISSLDYLWNKVRVLGGAYGSFATFGRSGNMVLASYRDPNLKETLDIYDDMKTYLENFDVDTREMTKYIIGTISNLDTPLTPSMKLDKAISCYMSGVSNEDLQRERNEVLNTSPEKIREFSKMVEAVMKENSICVLGNEIKIKENKDLFNELVDIFNF